MKRPVPSQFLKLVPIALLTLLLVSCGGADGRPEPTAAPTAIIEPTEPAQADEVEPEENSESATAALAEDALSGFRLLAIDPSQSETRFLVDEVLLGEDKTVVGATSQITGTISVDPTEPNGAEISTITIDARDITTDNNRRNRSIQRQIFRSALDENRYITFEPTAIEGLPDATNVGESFIFTVDGNLTVRGEIQPVTFEVSVMPVSPEEISGMATATILYKDFGITIPSVPAVASVEDEVRLELEFVAHTEGSE